MATLGEYLGSGSGVTKLLLHLNGNSTDSSGNGNNGTDTNITYSQANGRFGQGAGFNGSSSFSSFSGANVNFNYNSPFTIVAWIKPKTFVSELVVFSTLTNDGTLKGWEFSKSGTGLNFYLLNNWNGGAGPKLQVYCSDYISEEKWYNVILTYNGNSEASGVNFYVNGVKTTTSGASNLGTNSTATTNTLYFGKRVSGLNFNGSMDESFIETGTWSAEKVRKYFTMTKGRFGII